MYEVELTNQHYKVGALSLFLFISVADPQVINMWIEEVKRDSIKIQEKYTSLLKARGVRILFHEIYSCVPGYVKYVIVCDLTH